MPRNPGASGWVVVGVCLGIALCLFAQSFFDLSIETEVAVVDVLQIAATIFLALYIPMTIQAFLDLKRSSKALLHQHVRDFLDKVGNVNRAITDSANSGTTTPIARNQVIYGFKAAGMRLSFLEKMVNDECGKLCESSIRELKDCYYEYWKSVTSGSIYTTGNVDRVLYQAQEIRYVGVLAAGSDLMRSVDRN